MRHLHFRIPVNTLASSLDHMSEFPFTRATEAQFRGPTLFIRGTKSHYVPDDVLPLINGFFPSFELKDVDCGHWVISERREEFREGKISSPCRN